MRDPLTPARPSTTGIVIAAHNEANVIARCLDGLLAGAAVGEIDITVVANGCTDRTAEIARSRPGVRVVEIGVASKPAALNAADAIVVEFPRIYLDADITVSIDHVRALRDVLSADQPQSRHRSTKPLAAVPRREINVSGRPLLVRSYFAINNRLPVFRQGLFGRGIIAISEEGRARFDEFPAMIADDLYLDSLFTKNEKIQVDSFTTVVAAPLRTRDLLRRLVRVRRGNAAMRMAASKGSVPSGVREADRSSWLRDVVLPKPWLAPAGAAYLGITVVAAILARRTPQPDQVWGRGESSRL